MAFTHRSRRWLFLLPILTTGAMAQMPPPTTYEGALARYRECKERKPFRYHTEGREVLAKTGRGEALQLLMTDYATTKDYAEYTRYTLGTLFGRHFDDSPFSAPLRALREAQKKPVDAWLWVNSLGIEAQRDGTEGVLRIVSEGKSAWQKAAAIAALSHIRGLTVFDAIQIACAGFPKKDRAADRYLLLGAMSGAVFDNHDRARDPKARAGMTAYINLLAPAIDLPHTAKVQMARHLQWTLGGPGLLINPDGWLTLLEQGAPKASGGGNTVTQPRFFGIETEGERFCYVVDMSDSMCREIDPEVIPRGPVTGPKKKPTKGELPDSDDLPWHKIKTRFDLAREHLKLSLQRLSDDKYFSIVWFGTDAGTLPSCPGLMKATKANVQKAIKDLDAIIAGPAQPTAPDGVLRGTTNLHAGLRRAFSLSGREFVEEAAYVDPGPLVEGCDTIFLLSDGAPSWDEFEVVDKDYGEGDVVTTTEYDSKAARTPQLHYYGPYVAPDWLVDDTRRMNAFRRVRLHCIGIGEANMDLLKQLATLGHGEVYTVGRAGPKQGGK